jgi:hypothetical protein
MIISNGEIRHMLLALEIQRSHFLSSTITHQYIVATCVEYQQPANTLMLIFT